eukprot:8937664-Ditylum_brightwellii.AAC.1
MECLSKLKNKSNNKWKSKLLIKSNRKSKNIAHDADFCMVGSVVNYVNIRQLAQIKEEGKRKSSN